MNKFILDSVQEILLEFEKNSGPADIFLSSYFKKNPRLGSRDRSTIAEIYYGVIRHKRYLEELSGTRMLEKMIIMFVSHFQGKSLNSMKNFLNLETFKWLKIRKSQKKKCSNLPIKFSIPDWLWKKLSVNYDESFIINLTQSLLSPAELNIRVNKLKKITVEQVILNLKESFPEIKSQIIRTKFSDIGISLPRGTQINKHSLFLNGSIEVQDEGSQILSFLLDVKRGQMVADFCAGAGGKTLALADIMKNKGRLYAFDISEKRLSNLKKRLKKSGASNISPYRIVNENDLKIKRLHGKFDRVMVDVPCTGLGTLRRNPDLKWRYEESDLKEITNKQSKILNSASNLLKKGGYLLYATCSILYDENEQIVENFINQRTDFKIIPFSEILKNHEINNYNSDYLKLFPHLHGTDGFFGAVMEKI